MPRNARTNSAGYRWYDWTEPGKEPVRVLSVTSIRKQTGLPDALVTWKINNLLNLTMGTRVAIKIGPRGGVNEIFVPDGPFPGEFTKRLIATHGDDTALKELRQWTRAGADSPRDTAAVRGSVTHSLIELGVPMARLTDEYVTMKIAAQWQEERRKVKPAVTPDDVNFVTNNMRQYWDMREHVPFVILAREVQVWNLSAGYAGSLDSLIWFLPPGVDPKDVPARPTQADIARIGGWVAVGDWKTSKDLHTDNVVQVHAYMGAEFVGKDGVRDERLTAILNASVRGAIFHIRPNKWGVYQFPFIPAVMRAFLGSVMFARFLATYETPATLFDTSATGAAPGTEPSKEDVDDTAE